MTQRDFLESVEPGGPPYGVMYGSSFKLEDFIAKTTNLLAQNPDLKVLMKSGDIVEGLQKHSRP